MTAEAAKPEIKKPTAATKSPAKKAAKKGVNKSAEIRKVATAMKAKGEKPRPVVIIELLKKQGITVSSPQVSMVLKSMGFRPRRRRKTKQVGERSAPTAKKAGRMKIEDLVAAKKVASQLGGVDKALAALKALKDFEG